MRTLVYRLWCQDRTKQPLRQTIHDLVPCNFSTRKGSGCSFFVLLGSNWCNERNAMYHEKLLVIRSVMSDWIPPWILLYATVCIFPFSFFLSRRLVWNVITILRGISESMGSSPIDGAFAQLGGCVQGTVPALYANLGLCNGSKTRPRVTILKNKELQRYTWADYVL